jgi:hypothetical protein
MLAVTVLGFTFSGTLALVIAIVVVVLALGAWYFFLRPRR